MKKSFTRLSRAIFLLAMVLLSPHIMHAIPGHYQWTGAAGDSTWTNAANFFNVHTHATAVSAPGLSDTVEITPANPGVCKTSTTIGVLIVDAGATLENTTGGIIFRITYINNGTTTVHGINGLASTTTGSTINNSGNIYLRDNSRFAVVGLASSLTNSGIIDIDGTSFISLPGSLNNTGNITNSDGTTPTSTNIHGTVEMLNNAETITGNGYIDNLYINQGTHTVTIGSSVSDTLHIRNMLVINSGTLNTSNKLVLSPVVTSSLSNLSGVGMIGPISGTLTGGVTVSQYTPGLRAYRFYSHPFTTPISLAQIENCIDITGAGGNANGFTTTATNNPSAWWFNIATGNDADADGVHADPGWTAFTDATSTSGINAFNQYEGIYLFVRGAKSEGIFGETYTPSPAVITIYGDAVNTGDQTITLHTGPLSTFNMVGNPYPCTIDLNDALSRGGNSANLASLAYFVWDPYMATAGAFITQAIDATPHYLQPNTAFQVEAATEGVTLLFQESDKVSNLGSDNELLRQTATTKAQYVTLNVYDASYHLYDIFHLQLRDDATNAKEKADAGKPTNTDLNLYSIASTGERLSIDARPYVAGDVIPLGINAIKPQTFIIRADDFNVPAGATLSLHDKYKGIYKQLQKGEEYSFDITSVPASQGNGRFELQMGDVSAAVAKAATSLTVTPNPATEEINVAYNVQASDNASIRISNMLGQQVYTTSLGAVQNGTVTVPLQNIPAGIYMAELICGSKITTQRFVKQ